MKASEAAEDPCVVQELANLSKARVRAVHRVLVGLEVWPRTYRAVCRAAAGVLVTDIPPAAARAPRRAPPRPCPECARLRARIAELEEQLATPAAPALPASDGIVPGRHRAGHENDVGATAPAAIVPLPPRRRAPDATTVELARAVAPHQPRVRL